MKNVLFICRGNVGRSQIAEALLKHEAGNIFNVYSAGTKLSGKEQPIGELTPAINEVLSVMNEIGIDVSKNTRAELTPEMVEGADYIILTIDDNDPVPEYLLGNPKVIKWHINDPKGQSLEFTRNVRDQIALLVKDFIVKNS